MALTQIQKLDKGSQIFTETSYFLLNIFNFIAGVVHLVTYLLIYLGRVTPPINAQDLFLFCVQGSPMAVLSESYGVAKIKPGSYMKDKCQLFVLFL